MAQKIKIANIEIKEGEKDGKPWKRFVITSEDKSVASTFDNTASSLRVGDVIEAEIQLSGKYANIKTFKVVEKAETPAVKPTEVAKKTPPQSNREDAIAEAVAVKAVVELIACKAIPHNHPLFGAVIDWCWDKLLPNTVKLPEAPPSEPDKSTLGAVEEETNIISPVDELLNKVCEAKGFKTTKTARQFLLNVHHISGDRIESEPEKVWQEFIKSERIE